jgi:hypothetical protein
MHVSLVVSDSQLRYTGMYRCTWGPAITDFILGYTTSPILASAHAHSTIFVRINTANHTKILALILLVCPSVRMEQLGSHWTDFHEIL